METALSSKIELTLTDSAGESRIKFEGFTSNTHITRKQQNFEGNHQTHISKFQKVIDSGQVLLPC